MGTFHKIERNGIFGGGRQYAQNMYYGWIIVAVGFISMAFWAWIGGFIFDKTQSYRPAFVLALVVFIISCVFIWLAAPRRAERIM